MSAYISDGTLIVCQEVLHKLRHCMAMVGAEDTRELLYAIDEIEAGLMGIPIEAARAAREGREKITVDDVLL